MTSLNDHLLGLALRNCPEPMLITGDEQLICWSNLAAAPMPERVQGQSLDDYLRSERTIANYYQEEECRHLLRQINALPFGECKWIHRSSGSLGEQYASALHIRWQLLSELPERYCLITLEHRGRRRSDPGPAEQALKNQQLFTNQLIHELRTPLAIATGSLRRLSRSKTPLSLNHFEHLQVAQQELARITRLINNLTLLTDVDADSSRWHLSACQVSSILNSWWDELPPESKSAIRISIDPGCEHHFLQVDEQAVAIILNHLLDNSIRYAGSSAQTHLHISQVETSICLFHCDLGPGVASDQREHIFDRFRRLEISRDPAMADGSGLGLAITRALMKMMGSRIMLLDLDLRNFGASRPGAVFELSFPSYGIAREADRIPLRMDHTEAFIKSDELCAPYKQLAKYLSSQLSR